MKSSAQSYTIGALIWNAKQDETSPIIDREKEQYTCGGASSASGYVNVQAGCA